MEFSAPAAGSVLKPAELEGHLLVVEPTEYIDHVPTAMGDSDAIKCTVHDITNKTTTYDVMWFSSVLVGSLKSRIGMMVLAVMGKGIAKPGQTAPWVLNDASSEPAAVEAAKQYLATQPATPAPAAEPVVEGDELAAALAKLGAKPAF